MLDDLTPWDLAMRAIGETGCDCDGDPEDIATHTCLAGRCEYALRVERAEVERLRNAERRYNFWASVATDPESGWCGEHPRRVEAGTAGMVGRDTADGDDLCLACEVERLQGERDAARARAACYGRLTLSCPCGWGGRVADLEHHMSGALCPDCSVVLA